MRIRHTALLLPLALLLLGGDPDEVGPQVLVRTRFVSVEYSDASELGFPISGDPNAFDIRTLDSEPSSGLEKLPVIGQFFRTSVDPVVELLESSERSSVLAEPKLTVANGETASFFVGGNLTLPAHDGSMVTFEDFGVTLQITPVVANDGRVHMELIPSVSTLELSQGPRSISLPRIETRTQTTNVLVRDGQTLVLGGLFGENMRAAASQIPGLSQIPILGFLFGNRSFQEGKTHLILVVTPMLVGELRSGGRRIPPNTPPKQRPIIDIQEPDHPHRQQGTKNQPNWPKSP